MVWNSKDGVHALHIVATRSILFGEDSIDQNDLPAVRKHITSCTKCTVLSNKTISDPSFVTLRKRSHPTSGDLSKYTLLSKGAVTDLSEERIDEISMHVGFCVKCARLLQGFLSGEN